MCERFGGGDGLYRGSAPAAQEPERLAAHQRRLLEGHGADVREEDHDPGRPQPREELPARRRPAGQQAGQPGRGAGAAPERDGGSASAGHVSPLSALVSPRVHPGVQGKLPGPQLRLQRRRPLRPAGERILRRGRRVLPGSRGHAHRRAAGRGGGHGPGGGSQERERRKGRQQQQLAAGLVSRDHLNATLPADVQADVTSICQQCIQDGLGGGEREGEGEGCS